MKIIVTFSGGKDSLAALLWVRNNMSKKFTTVFCDTGWNAVDALRIGAIRSVGGFKTKNVVYENRTNCRRWAQLPQLGVNENKRLS